MIDEQAGTVRRAILQKLERCYPAPYRLEDIALAPEIIMLRIPAAELRTEWYALQGDGFIDAIADSNGEYVRISAAGRGQIRREVKLDQRIWGAAAI